MPPPANPFRILTISKSVPPCGERRCHRVSVTWERVIETLSNSVNPKNEFFLGFFSKAEKHRQIGGYFSQFPLKKRLITTFICCLPSLNHCYIEFLSKIQRNRYGVTNLFQVSGCLIAGWIDFNSSPIKIASYIVIEIKPYKERQRDGSKHP